MILSLLPKPKHCRPLFAVIFLEYYLLFLLSFVINILSQIFLFIIFIQIESR